MPPAADSGTQYATPLQRVEALKEQVDTLKEQVDAIQQRAAKRDPVSARMYGLATVVCLLAVVGYLGGVKVLTVEVIAAILGAIAGRLTSNIGGSTDSSDEGARKP